MAEAPDEMVVKVRAEFDPGIEDVKRLTLREGDRLVLVMGEDWRPTQDNVTRLERYVQHAGLTHPALILPHGTKLAVLGPEEAAEAARSDAHDGPTAESE